MGFKSHPLLFIAVKSKGNLKKIKFNKRLFDSIKNLNLISHEDYFKVHSDCLNQNIVPEIHYLYYFIEKTILETKTPFYIMSLRAFLTIT